MTDHADLPAIHRVTGRALCRCGHPLSDHTPLCWECSCCGFEERTASDWLASPEVTAALARFRAEDAALCDAHVETWERAEHCQYCAEPYRLDQLARIHDRLTCRGCAVMHETQHHEATPADRAWGRRIFGLDMGD